MMRTPLFGFAALAAMAGAVVPIAASAQLGDAGTVLRGAAGLPSTVGGVPNGLGSTLTGQTAQSNGGLLGNVFGCSAPGSTQIIGAVGGGVVGGLVGNKVQKTFGTIAGGAIGAAAGSWLGCKLQRSSQVRAERAAQNAAVTGQGQTWSDPANGASGRSDVVAGHGQSLAGLRLAQGVTPIADYQMGGGITTVAKAANVRGAPAVSAPLLGKLRPGQTVTVSALTRDSSWSLISQDGIGQGYVATALLGPTRPDTAGGCKVIRQTVQSGGQSQSELLNACPNANGGWTFSRAN